MVLRELEIKDASTMSQTLNDADVNRYMNIGEKPTSIETCIDFINNSHRDEHNKHFAIVDEDDSWVGTISLKNIDFKVKQAEYAIITSSRVHGKGYAFKATEELLEYAFKVLKLQRVYLNVTTQNVRANKFYTKCGFTFEGTFRQAILIKGQLCDLNWYAMLAEDYERRLTRD